MVLLTLSKTGYCAQWVTPSFTAVYTHRDVKHNLATETITRRKAGAWLQSEIIMYNCANQKSSPKGLKAKKAECFTVREESVCKTKSYLIPVKDSTSTWKVTETRLIRPSSYITLHNRFRRLCSVMSKLFCWGTDKHSGEKFRLWPVAGMRAATQASAATVFNTFQRQFLI